MHETQEILAAWRRAREDCVLATVVETTGSTYRRPGARMLVGAAGRLAGGISGGCLERDLVRKAWWLTAGGRPAVVVYDATADGDDARAGFGMGCNGTVTVLLERVPPPPAEVGVLAFLDACVGGRRPGVMATVIAARGDGAIGARLLVRDGAPAAGPLPDARLSLAVERDAREALRSGRSSQRTYDGGTEIFLEVVTPPRGLTVFGGGPDVPPLVQVAKLVGWHVTVVERRASQATEACRGLADRVLLGAPERLAPELELSPDAAGVIMTHNFDRDRALLDALLPSELGYLGLLGPRARAQALLERLTAPPHAAGLVRLHAPVGLDIGAEGPQQIGVAVVAEIQAHFAGRPGGPRSRSP